MNGWLRKLGRIVGVCLLAFLLLEVLLFLFNDYVFHSSFYIFDPQLGFRVRPYASFGDSQANRFGFNDKDYPLVRQPATYRILVLGDSFNWMGGRERNYVSLLDKLFEEEFGPGRVEVINAGYSQTHTAEQLALLNKYGILYKPDLTVLSVFAGNDFYDADPNRKRIAIGGGMTDVFADRDFYAVVLGKPVVLQSRLVLYLREKWRSLEKRAEESPKIRTGRSQESSGRSKPLRTEVVSHPLSPNYLNSLHLRTQFNRRDRFDDFELNVELVTRSVLAMEAVLKERGIRLAVAVFPDEIEVDSEIRQAFLSHYKMESVQYEWSRARSILRQLCLEHDIPFLDLYPDFLDATQAGGKHYLPNNGHWNDAGNELAARFLFNALKGQVQVELGLNSAE